MSKNLGDIVTVKVDPSINDGYDEAPAMITRVYDDGSYRLRVIGMDAATDAVRNYVGEDGEPFDGLDTAPANTPGPANPATPAEPATTTAGAPAGAAGLPAGVNLTELAQQLIAALQQQGADTSTTSEPTEPSSGDTASAGA